MKPKPTAEAPEFSEKQVCILEAAERLFSVRGFVGTTVREIAHEAGVNVAMIAYYFGSKEQLLLAVFTHRISAARIQMEYLLADKNLSPIEKMEALVESTVDRMLKHRDFHRVLLNAQLTSGNEELAGIIADTKVKNLEIVRKMIADGQRQKVFTRGIDATMLVLMITGTIYQVATGSAYLKAAYPHHDATDAAFEERIRKNLIVHLKRTLKAVLTYEA